MSHTLYAPGQRLDELQQFLAVIAAQLADGARPARVETPFGLVELDYRTDDDDEDYVFVPYHFVSGAWSVEIDSDTYGALHGFRYYPG